MPVLVSTYYGPSNKHLLNKQILFKCEEIISDTFIVNSRSLYLCFKKVGGGNQLETVWQGFVILWWLFGHFLDGRIFYLNKSL